MITPFNTLPDHSRLWIFNASRPLDAQEQQALRAGFERFLDQWAAHGSALKAGYEIRHDRFILIGVDDSMVGPSGCSIDTLTRFFKEAQSVFEVDFLDAPDVCYRAGDEVRCVDRNAFSGLAESGDVDSSTIVYDNTAATIGALRGGGWERPAAQSWHARAFDLKPASQESAA